jgi:1,4-dihydroxy-2-naphthoate octaprenyltransferase
MKGPPDPRTPSRREVWLQKLLYPGHTLPTVLGPVLLATALAARRGVLSWRAALAALLAGWLVQLGGVIADNYQNLARHADDREHPLLVSALESGVLSLGELRRAALACYALALLPGAHLVWIGGPPVLVAGAAAIAASWIYSGGPLPLKYYGLAEPLFFLFFGIVSVVGSYYVQAASTGDPFPLVPPPGSLPDEAFLLSIPAGALITSILVIDDIRDLTFDREKGERSFTAIFGLRAGRGLYLGLIVAAYLVPPALAAGGTFDRWILLPLISLPGAVGLARYVLSHEGHRDLIPATPRAGRLLLIYAGLLALGVLV